MEQILRIIRLEMEVIILCTGAGTCLLYTSDAADEEDSGGLGGSRVIKKKKKIYKDNIKKKKKIQKMDDKTKYKNRNNKKTILQ